MNALGTDDACRVTHEVVEVVVFDAPRRDALRLGVGTRAVGLGAHVERRQQLDLRIDVTDSAESLAELGENDVVLRFVPRTHHGHDRTKARHDEIADAAEGAIEVALAADRVVGGGVGSVDADAKLEIVPAKVADLAQSTGDVFGDQDAVGQHGE